MANKTDFVYDVILAARRLASVMDVADALVNEYQDNTFQVDLSPAAAEAIVDGDVTQYQITAADVGAGMTLLEQFSKFCNNDGTQVTGDYADTINALRRGHSGT